MSGGCWLNVILSVENNLLVTALQESGHQKDDLVLRITTFLIQLFKHFDKISSESRDTFNYVTHLMQKIRNDFLLNLKVQMGFHKDLHVVCCKNMYLNKLLKRFCSITVEEENEEIHFLNVKLHQIELNCTYAEKKELNVRTTSLIKSKSLHNYNIILDY